jgi:hypothetical protein
MGYVSNSKHDKEKIEHTCKGRDRAQCSNQQGKKGSEAGHGDKLGGKVVLKIVVSEYGLLNVKVRDDADYG